MAPLAAFMVDYLSMAPMLDHNSRILTVDSVDSSSLQAYELAQSVTDTKKPRSSSRAKTQARNKQNKQFPRVDDHLIKPEVSQFELIRGREVDVSGADPPHADAQSRLSFLILAHIVAGFIVASELLTRMAKNSNFATDVCIRKAGIDPETNTRYLEELAFEIVNTQRKRNVTEKADDMAIRGVRRVFAVFLKTGQVAEWSAKQRTFIPFEKDALIHDPTFVRPIPVQAILDEALGQDEAALALIAKRNPVIMKRERDVEQKSRKKGLIEGHKKGLDEGLALGRTLLVSMLQMRFGDIPARILRRIESADASSIQVWGRNALTSTSLNAVFKT